MGEFFLIFLLKLLSFLYGAQPRQFQLFLGSQLGWILRQFKFRSKVVKKNLHIAFPEQRAQQETIYREFYSQFGNLVCEILLLFGPMKNFVFKNVQLLGIENWERARREGKGVLFLSSHVGNWEVMSAAGALIGKIDLLLVTKLLKPVWFHREIENGRKGCGVKGTYEPRTLRDVLSHLKKNGTVGFVLDQYTGPPIGVRVPVFNIPVGTSTVLATLAKRTGAKVLPVKNFRKPDGSWVVEISPALDWKSDPNPHLELAMNTAEYARIVEKHILQHPEQWLWTHRRFKGDLSPLGEDEWKGSRLRH